VSAAARPAGSGRRAFVAPLIRRVVIWLLPVALGACGGGGCNGCSGAVPKPVTPNALVTPEAVQFRVTQAGFDVVANEMVALLKVLFGATKSGDALIDVSKLLPGANLGIGGGLGGLFSSKVSVRDLVLTLDMAKLSIKLVDPSAPARIRIVIDKADLGVHKGVLSGETKVLGIKSDAACHLKNGVDVGKSNERLATVSATIDLVLGVDAKGALDVKAEVKKPILHAIGFALGKDCGLSECKDKQLVGNPCLECELCATGKITSDVINALKGFLEPILSDLLQLVANLLIKAIIEPTINGKPLDLEIPLDLKTLVAAANAQFGALLGDANPIRLRVRPSPNAFSVADKALRGKLDGATFAKAHGCVVDPGPDDAAVFGKLPQGPAPPLPASLKVTDSSGGSVDKPIDAGALIGRRLVEQAFWSAMRSGLLCTSIDGHGLYALSGKKLVLVAALMDLALPGLRQLVPPDAPLRLTIGPSASVSGVPRVHLTSDGAGGVTMRASLKKMGLRIEAAAYDRWLTLVELDADAIAVFSLRIDADGQLRVQITDVQVPTVTVASSALFPKAEMQTIAGPLADLGLSVLLTEPMTFDVDLDAILASAIKLPISAALVGLQAGGDAQDWLVIGITLVAKGTTP